MNQDINTEFKKDIINLMSNYVKTLEKIENERITDIDNKFIKSISDNTFHHEEHKKLILSIAKDILLSQDTQNGITVDYDTVIDGVCRVKTNDDIVKPNQMNSTEDYYKKVKINKSSLKDPVDNNLVHIKNKLMNIQTNLDTVEQLGLYLNLNDNYIMIELLLRYKK